MSTILEMTPNQALSAATKVSGELLGVEAGVLDVDRPADLLLLDGNLETDTLALRAPRAVIKGGAIAIER
jgi:imidazolonepropionase-like amidohydrolase